MITVAGFGLYIGALCAVSAIGRYQSPTISSEAQLETLIAKERRKISINNNCIIEGKLTNNLEAYSKKNR